jgi:hypothetical protein
MPAFPNRVTLGRTGLSVCPLAVSGGYGVDDKSLLRALLIVVSKRFFEDRRFLERRRTLTAYASGTMTASAQRT